MSEVIPGAKLGKVQARVALLSRLGDRVARLEAFARRYVRCPCCDHDRRCDPECEHRQNAPEQHAEMVAAREALYGEEVNRGE